MELGGFRPGYAWRPAEITINPFGHESIGVQLYSTAQVPPVSQNFVTANLAVFVPFGVPETTTITKLFWTNGSAVAGNLDAGIYDTAGVRLVSTGSTAQATITTTQVVDVTDTVLARGVYYLALASDTSGITQKVIAALPSVGLCQLYGLLQMATAFPLPDPATFAVYASAYVPLFGAQGYRALGP